MATITVGTNSYVTVSELEAYADDRGITISATDKSVLLIKAMDYLETRTYKGLKTITTQTLEFPRVFCGYDYAGLDELCLLDINEVPQDIKNAQMTAALILDTGDEIQPTLGRAVKKEKADVLEVEYSDNALASKQYTKLNDILRPYLANSHPMKVVRM